MKNLNDIYRNLVLFAFFLFVLPSNSQIINSEKKIIVIDPGHGGTDSGAVGINGIKEKDVVLDIALEMARINRANSPKNIEIYLTRYSDTLISLNDRTKLAKALEAGIFISLHCNHAHNPNARGTEVYVSNIKGKFMRESILLGFAIEKALVSHIGLDSRGVKFANFQILRDTLDYCTAVLIEIGFLSNMGEANYLVDNKNLKLVAFILLKKIIKNKF